MLAKTWRVYYIFRNIRLKKRVSQYLIAKDIVFNNTVLTHVIIINLKL